MKNHDLQSLIVGMTMINDCLFCIPVQGGILHLLQTADKID